MRPVQSALASRLLLSSALAGVFLTAGTQAFAQNETVTVTGTSIRGQQPVGANVITVDRAVIEATGAQTTSQLLQTIPQLDNFGSAAQGGQNSADGGTQAPTIHSLGSSASNSTLILIDGHRFPLTGTFHNLSDPSIIPASAVANVEILPDGASAIYGSDAVAGVINLHTRKDYSGWETGVQYGIADHYNTFDFSQLFGHSWDSGGLIAVYNFSNRSNLMNRERSFITARQDLRLGAANPSLFTGLPLASSYGTSLQTVAPNGQAVPYPSIGGNFQDLTSCPVATISTSSAATVGVFTYPYTGSSIPRQTNPSGGPSTGICDVQDFQTALPSEVRNQGLVSVHQALNDKLALNFDLVYASKLGSDHAERGGISNATVFSPFAGTGGPAFGSNQTNPFYVTVPGATGAQRNSEFISLDFTQLLANQGIGYASTKTGQQTVFITAGLDYDLGGDWLLSLGGTAGTDLSFTRSTGALNTAEAFLALNGTVNTSGTAVNSAATSALPDPYGLGTIVNVTRALTTANALDVWNPAVTNRTSASVVRSLVDSSTYRPTVQGMQDVTLHADGPIMDLFGAGFIKAAIGAEYLHETMDQKNTSRNNTGPSSTSSNFLSLTDIRTAYAAYAEFVIPVIGPDMKIPLIQKLTFDLAGRYDYYSDFGNTRNPKIAVSWDIIDGVRTSASFGTSFTAPQIGSTAPITTVSASNTGATNGLVVLFNDTRPFNNGAGIAGTFVSNAISCAAGGSTPVTDAAGNTAAAAGAGDYPTAIGCKYVVSGGTASQGLRTSNIAQVGSLKPQLGQSYSVNLALDFGKFWDVLEGLNTQVTYYQAKLNNAITNIGIITTNTNYGLPELTTFAPANGCTSLASLCGAGQANQPGWAPSDPFLVSFFATRTLTTALPSRLYSIQSFAQTNAFILWQNGLDFKVDYRYATDNIGDFTFGVSGNQILRATQQNGVAATLFDAKDGNNGGRFLNVELTGRANINWHMEPFTVGLSFSYRHPYNQSNVTVFPFNFPGPGRLAGFQHIGALQTFDLNVGYNLPADWWSGTRLNMTVTNLFDAKPAFVDSANGFFIPGTTTNPTGNVIGRIMTFGVTKKW